jgi:hypothetical protein
MGFEDDMGPKKNIRPSKQINKIRHNTKDNQIKNIEDILYNFTIDVKQFDITKHNMFQYNEYDKMLSYVSSKIIKYDSDGPYYSDDDEYEDNFYEKEKVYEEEYTIQNKEQFNNNKQSNNNFLAISDKKIKNNDNRCKKKSIKNTCRHLLKY